MNTIDQIIQQVDIVAFMGQYAKLKRTGRNYRCKSPLRKSNSMSFSVSPERQLWYDFVLGKGGNVVNFIEEMEGVSFSEALQILADKTGIELPKFSKSENNIQKEKSNNLFMLHDEAQIFFRENLSQNISVKDYLTRRSLTAEEIKNWGIGYSPDSMSDLTKHLLSERFSHELISESGVAFDRNFGDKSMKDRFIDRIMIPIRESRNGNIVAFGGRLLTDKPHQPKYLNSPESQVYNKSQTLFGLYEARKKISTQDRVIIVEGYFDVISGFAAGFPTTVATCGTSLTQDHLTYLKRLTKNIYLAFDNDIAGKKATLRAVEMCLDMELLVRIMDISSEKDFDDACRKDASQVQKAFDDALPALDFLIDKFAIKHLTSPDVHKEKLFLESVFYFLSILKSPIEIDYYLQKTAKKINRNTTIVEQEFIKYQQKKFRRPRFQSLEKEEEVGFTRSEFFVGFLWAFWEKLEPIIDEKNREKILTWITESKARVILSKKFNNEALTEEERLRLNGWQMHQENLYARDVSPKLILQELKTHIHQIREPYELQKRTSHEIEQFKLRTIK